MTPKQKADYLIRINSLTILSEVGNYLKMIEVKNLAKQCALIAVDEILNNNCGSHTDESNAKNEEIYCDEYYWQEVKQEIEKL